jgi:hypothetical protein
MTYIIINEMSCEHVILLRGGDHDIFWNVKAKK